MPSVVRVMLFSIMTIVCAAVCINAWAATLSGWR
jgi:hypothetical protein